MSGYQAGPNSPASQIEAALRAGIETLGVTQTVTFTQYVRYVLPLDGFVFWVRGDLAGAAPFFGAAPRCPTLTAVGVLHYSIDIRQEPDSVYSADQVVFTSEVEVQDLNAVDPTTMYIAQVDNFRFAFSRRGMYFRQANIYHYTGEVVKAGGESLIVDDPAQLVGLTQVFSNSMPLWLALIQPVLPVIGLTGTSVQLFPAYLSPLNHLPPYGTVDVMSTEALGAYPILDKLSTHTQLMKDRVRVTLYGLDHPGVMDFLDYVLSYSAITDAFGLMNMPGVQDEKDSIVELQLIAQKKSIEFEISYFQVRVRDVARQLIESCIPTYNGTPGR